MLMVEGLIILALCAVNVADFCVNFRRKQGSAKAYIYILLALVAFGVAMVWTQGEGTAPGLRETLKGAAFVAAAMAWTLWQTWPWIRRLRGGPDSEQRVPVRYYPVICAVVGAALLAVGAHGFARGRIGFVPWDSSYEYVGLIGFGWSLLYVMAGIALWSAALLSKRRIEWLRRFGGATFLLSLVLLVILLASNFRFMRILFK